MQNNNQNEIAQEFNRDVNKELFFPDFYAVRSYKRILDAYEINLISIDGCFSNAFKYVYQIYFTNCVNIIIM